MTRLFITGLPRSGTSMTAQVLEACGAEFGTNLGRAATGNRYGFYEDLAMRRFVEKPWLERIGADKLAQWPLPEPGWEPTDAQVEAFRADVAQHLKAPCHKSPKTLALWPLYWKAFPKAKWLVVRRDREAVLSSVLRTRFMIRFDTPEEWKRWVVAMEYRLDVLRDAVGAVECWPDPKDPESFRKAVEALGYTFSEGAVRGVLHPEVWGAS